MQMWLKRVEIRWLSTVAARSIGVLAVEMVVVHRRQLAIPYNLSGMPMALIEDVIGQEHTVVPAGAINPKTIHGITIER